MAACMSVADISGWPLIMCLSAGWQGGGISPLLRETSRDRAEAAAVDICETLVTRQ